ncbi:MAG: phage tail sheath C-terminal domain-containing protein [Xanthobacteraceae bacterium]
MASPVSPQVTYPGVYIQEVASGSSTITGVATSITAFVGRTLMGPMGPTEPPMHCFSYAEFERHFGGRSYDYPLSYAVEDFFQNGGSHAVIVRVTGTDPHSPSSPPGSSGDAAAKARVSIPAAGPLKLEAASAGAWANDRLAVSVDASPSSSGSPPGPPRLIDQAAERFKRYGVDPDDLFNLTLKYTRPDGQVVTERHVNLTVKNAPNRIDRVLKANSRLAVVALDPTDPAATPVLGASSPAATTALPFTGGSDGPPLTTNNFKDLVGHPDAHTGIYALDKVDLFNLMCIPWDERGQDVPLEIYQKAADYCVKRRAMLVVDPPVAWRQHAFNGDFASIQPTDLDINGLQARNCAVYFPKVIKPDDEMGGTPDVFPACGIIAGVMATTDASRGVWKAPAGINAGIAGIVGLEGNITDAQNGMLNQLGINCLRNFPVIGPVVWGARTLRGADLLSDDYKYVPVRRLTLFIEESLYRGTQFAVFEPNDETLWSHLRLTIGTFMADLARQGAFYGYQVTCDKTTTTPDDIDHGIVNVRVAFAPVKPAEFVVLFIQQLAGQAAS